jgi:hypothetical protein
LSKLLTFESRSRLEWRRSRQIFQFCDIVRSPAAEHWIGHVSTSLSRWAKFQNATFFKKFRTSERFAGHWLESPVLLEGLAAPFPRHLSGSFVSGYFRFRKDQLQPDQQEHRPPHQIHETDADTGEEVSSDDIVKGYKVGTENGRSVSRRGVISLFSRHVAGTQGNLSRALAFAFDFNRYF